MEIHGYWPALALASLDKFLSPLPHNLTGAALLKTVKRDAAIYFQAAPRNNVTLLCKAVSPLPVALDVGVSPRVEQRIHYVNLGGTIRACYLCVR